MSKRSPGISGVVNNVTIIVVLGSLLALVFIGTGYVLAKRSPPRLTVTSAGPTIDQLQELAELIVLRLQISDVLKAEGSGVRMAVLVRGDCDIVIDLNQARMVDKNDSQRTVKLVLPSPRLNRPRVDHDRTLIYDVKKDIFVRDRRSELFKECMKRAQELVEYASSKDEEKARARRHAELVIQTFYRQFDWKVKVVWEEPSP